MGSNSSSAALRSEAAFGSLASMGARKLKKKPVLVVDADELAQAHQLFQQGAAELMGEYEPEQRPRAAVSLFGLAPLADGVEDERFALALSPLNDDDEDPLEGEEAEVPAPEKVLSLTRSGEPKPLPANIFGSLPDVPVMGPGDSNEPEPKSTGKQAPRPAPLGDLPTPRPRLVRNFDDIAPGFSHRDPVQSAPMLPPRTEPTGAPTSARASEQQTDPITELALPTRPPVDDGVAAYILFDEDADARPAPAPPEPAPLVQSSLRARLVREDVSLIQPKPSLWQRVVGLVQRWYWSITGR